MCIEEDLMTQSVRVQKKLATFCEPLRTHFNVSGFYFHRVTDDGHLFVAGSNKRWNEGFITEKLYLKNPYYRSSCNFESRPYFHDYVETPDHHNCLAVAKKYGVFPFVQFMQKNNGIVDTYGFNLAEPNPKYKARLLRDLSLLERFISAFKEQFISDIRKVENYRVNIAQAIGPKFYDVSDALLLPANRRSFLKDIESPLGKLSAQEWHVFQYWSKGLSAKEIATKMKLSKRTVEHYKDTIKYKLECSNRIEILDRYLENNINILPCEE